MSRNSYRRGSSSGSRRLAGACMALGVAACVTGRAAAADTPPPPPPADTAVGDIIVTAQKRAQNLQSVPISVSAVSAQSLANSGIREASDLSAAVPGLNIQRNTTATIFFLRGVGTATGSPGLDSAIATFVDGVYIPSMTGSTFSLNNIERIEVLKGPQGTLYGRNATGGAVNVITRTPSHDTSVEGSFGFGNLQTVDATFYGTTGLTEKIAVDLAASYHVQNRGFGTNLFNGQDIYAGKDENFRSKMLVDLTETTRLTLAGDYAYTNGSYGLSYRAVPSSTLLDGQIGYHGRYYDTDTDVQPHISVRQYGGSAKLEQDLGRFKITNIVAYRHQKAFQNIDVDATPIDIVHAPLSGLDKQLTEEVQLSYTSDRLNALAGFFYLDSTNAQDPFRIEGLGVAPLDEIVINDRQKTKSVAVFGQATYEIFTDTNLTAGIRYTRDKRELSAVQQGVIGGALISIGPDVQKSATFSKPSWRLALDHKLSPDMMVYGSYSRGFKSGVYNLSAPNDPVVKPETLDAYEIGIKSKLFDRRLRFNVAGFLYNYKNIQLQLVRGASTLLLNAATSRMYGIDAEVQWAVASRFSLQGGGSWIHDRYSRFDAAPFTVPNPLPPFGNTTFGASAKGRRMINTPDFTASMAADYRLPLAGGELDLNATYAYNDGFFWEADNRVRQNAYSLVNTQIKWTAPNQHFNVRVWAKNLLDKQYLTSVNEAATGDFGTAAPGRTYGGSFGFKF